MQKENQMFQQHVQIDVSTRGKILVVDDDREARRQIKDILTKANFSVVTAEDGFQAIKLAENHHFDLVMLDVVMDKMDGYKVCQFLKSKKDFYSPVIFLTTRTNLSDIVMGFSLGADDYIAKPFIPEELLARIDVGLRLKSYQDKLRSRQTALEQSMNDLELSKMALEKKVIDLKTMFETFSTIHATLDAYKMAHGAILSMMGHKGISFAMVMSPDQEKSNFFVPLFYHGLDNFTPSDFWFSYDEPFIKFLEEKASYFAFDEIDESFLTLPNLQLMKQFSPKFLFPLMAAEKLHGILIIGGRITGKDYSKDDLEFLQMMAMELSGALRKAEFYNDLKRKSDELEEVYVDTLRVLANAIEARDSYTIGHTWRVCRFAQTLARELGWDKAKIDQIEIGGLLHDIGKIGIDDSILRKPSRLSKEEYERMKQHPELGAKMLSNIEFLKPYLPYILFHQERYDGHGYPTQLSGKEIPVEGRLLAIADAFDAMTSDRPYRNGLSPVIAIEEIKKLREKQFDPEMSDAFIKIFNEGKLTQYLQKKDKSGANIFCPICHSSLILKDLLLKGSEYICPICKHPLEVSLKKQKNT